MSITTWYPNYYVEKATWKSRWDLWVTAGIESMLGTRSRDTKAFGSHTKTLFWPALLGALSWGNNLVFMFPRTLYQNAAPLTSVNSSAFHAIRDVAKRRHVAESTVIILSTFYSTSSLETTDHCPRSVLVSTVPHSLDFPLTVFLSCISFLCCLPLLRWTLYNGDPQGSEIALLFLHLLPRCYRPFP